MLKVLFVSLIMLSYIPEYLTILMMSGVGIMLMFANPLLFSSSKFIIMSLGMNLSLLSVWILLVVAVMSVEYKIENYYFSEVKLLVFFMMVVLLEFFFTDSLLMFYILFEVSLLPLMCMMLGWGSQPERIQAVTYMFLYTVIASLPLFVVILILGINGMNYFLSIDLSMEAVKPWFGFIFIPFLVKVPAFMFHLWLPKAHVESPSGGSMILAGIMLKIGFYGICQMSGLMEGGDQLMDFLVVSGLVGGLSAAIICLRQVDMKRLVAYSSVCHMGLMMAGLFSGGECGMSSLMMVCMSHGLTSAGLFFLTGLIYFQGGTRSLLLIRGIFSVSPMFGLWMFFFCVSNMAAPFTLGIMGEISILTSSSGWSFILLGLIMLYSFLSAGYSIYLFSASTMSSLSLVRLKVMSVKDNLILMTLFMPLVLLMVGSDTLMV